MMKQCHEVDFMKDFLIERLYVNVRQLWRIKAPLGPYFNYSPANLSIYMQSTVFAISSDFLWLTGVNNNIVHSQDHEHC